METHGLEHDLLDLIEGRLAPERVEAVRRALSRDPALLRAVERMVADRRGLIELGKATAQASMGRAGAEAMVREAIDRAEQEMLFAHTEARGARRRLTAIAAAVGIVVAVSLLASGLTWYVVRQNQATQLAIASKGEGKGARMTDVDGDETQTGAGTVLAEGLPETGPATGGTPVASLPSWVQPTSDPMAKEAVRSWTRSVEETLAALPSSGAGANGGSPAGAAAGNRALERVRAGGDKRLTLEEAAGLALTHRLRLVIPAAGTDWNRRRAEVAAAAAKGTTAGVAADVADSALERGELRVEVTAAMDPENAGLRDALGDLRKRLGGASPDAWFELESTDPDPSAAEPSLRLADILWWSNAPSAWTPGVSVRIRVAPASGEPR